MVLVASTCSGILRQMADNPWKLRGVGSPLDLNAEIRKAMEPLRLMSIDDEFRKALEPLRVVDQAAALTKALEGARTFDMADQLRKVAEAPAQLSKFWRASIGALQPHDSLAQLRRAMNPRPLDVLSELRRITAAALAPQPKLEELLAVSLVAYQNLYGQHDAAAIGHTSAFEWPGVGTPGRSRRTRRRARGKRRRTVTAGTVPALPQNEASLNEALEKLDAASRRRDVSLLLLEVLLGTIISILMALYQNRLSDKSEQRILARVAAVEANLADRIASIETRQDHRPLVYARRQLTLRKAPRSRAESAAQWHQNVPGRVVTERRYWVRVEFYDRQENEHKAGWCLKKWVIR
jgi:hypothetical protein